MIERWSCGHTNYGCCMECHQELIQRANGLAAEIERLLPYPTYCHEVAAFLDRMAERFVQPRDVTLVNDCWIVRPDHEAAAECRREAKKLRGETNPYGEGDPAEIEGT